MPQPIFLLGPTCVGKSSVAIKLARDISAEIVSCDSMQVYQGMDIGTSKPTEEEQKLIPHHMIDVVPLTKEYNVAQYVRDASSVIDDIKKRNKIPLIVGGTGLYFKALVSGLFIGPKADSEIRNKLEERVKKEGISSLYNELKKFDPVSANKIKSQDKRRIIRAVEVYYITGKPISSFQIQWSKTSEPLRTKVGSIIGLNRDRKHLYDRINCRVEKMFQDGLVNEVRELIKKGLIKNKTANQALGYKEVLDYLDGKHSLEKTKELIKINTRHFAKRQLTWFRKDDRVKWVLIGKDESSDSIVEKLVDFLYAG